MTRLATTHAIALAGFCALTLGPDAALAYTGPGAGITAIGSLLALVAALLLGLVGFIWYPLKRLMKGRTRSATGHRTDAAPTQ